MKKTALWALAFSLFFAFAFTTNMAGKKWQTLFNGEDLSNWDVYIGAEFKGGEWNEWTKGPRLGLNNDPDGLFKAEVLNGEPVIHVSGKRFGGLSTHQEFENFHLQLQFKWGEHKYAPKDKSPRDSGLLYHAVGEHGADSGFWMRSQEFQIQEGDTGDYWGCAGATFDVPVKVKGADFIYDPEGELLHFSPAIARGRHAVKSVDPEKPSGEWNTIDLYCFGGTAIHVINGQKNMVLYNSSQIDTDGKEIPLTNGKIQLQAEGAEIYFKNIRIRPIAKLPKKYLE
tara:strand:+ start:1885 stop:2736 length:852 start_codon:yes stop_codon:yes gene_type:complete